MVPSSQTKKMARFIIAAILTGVLFGAMDGLINGNPYAVKLMECFSPIAKQTKFICTIRVFVNFFRNVSLSSVFL